MTDAGDGLRLTEATIVHHPAVHGEGRGEWSLVDAHARWASERAVSAHQASGADPDGELAVLPVAEWGAEILSSSEAAQRANISPRSLRRWVQIGVLQPMMSLRSTSGHTHTFRAIDVDHARSVMRARETGGRFQKSTSPLEDLRRLEDAEAGEEAAEAESGRAFDELNAALAKTTPGCLDDETFTADEYGPTETAALAAVCAACPALEQCRAYAIATQPSSGFWAGAPAAAYAST